MSNPYIDFQLDELSIEIISERMKLLGLDFKKDFDKYFQKIISKEMEARGFNSCDETTCKVKRKAFKKTLSPKKNAFIQCLATKKNTTLSNVICILLLKSGKVD